MTGETSGDAVPSLDVLLTVALEERALRHQAVDMLDQKAGILLALDGALLGLAAATSSWWTVIPVAAVSSVAAAFAFHASRLREYRGLDLIILRSKYLTAEESNTKLMLLDTLSDGLGKLADDAEGKSRSVKISFWITAAGVILFAILSVLATLQPSWTEVTNADANRTYGPGGAHSASYPAQGGPGSGPDLHKGR